MTQFDRQYRFAAGRAGRMGFEIGETTHANPVAMHISFSVEKADTETPNTARISLWNLSPAHLATINSRDCAIALRAGYANMMTLIFVGTVTYTETTLDGADRETAIEAVDGRVELRDTYVSLSYSGAISSKKIIADIAKEMGVTLSFSYNARFASFQKGFSYVGSARGALDKACSSGGLSWQMQNGILQVKMRRDTMTREVYVLSPDSGLLGVPKKITVSADGTSDGEQSGWEVEYLLNGAIGIGDYVRLESSAAKGYFRVHSVVLEGDNHEGDWMCSAKLIEA